MEPLLEITTVPIQYELKITEAKLEYSQGTAEVEISRNTDGGLQIKSRPVQLNMDTFDTSPSTISPTPMQNLFQAALKGTQIAYQATAQAAKEGRILLHARLGENPLSEISGTDSQKSTNEITTSSNMNGTPPELSIQYEMDKLNFDSKIGSGDFQFIPGDIELVITQYPDVVVKYTGKPIYVPPSAADDFSYDVQA